MNRRDFLTSAMYSSFLMGAGALPRISSNAYGMAAPLDNKLLINLYLDGGPDFRHLIVPAYDPAPDSYGNKYWQYRARSHRLNTTNQNAWDRRWRDDYFPITVSTVDNENWDNSKVVDSQNLNTGVTFGIWRGAGWLIDMFVEGNAALVFNAVGGTNRAHDLSTRMLLQGNLESNSRDYSGWGGRVARSADSNIISVTSSPNAFCFGPTGIPGEVSYNAAAIDNQDLINVQNARDLGLFDFDFETNQFFNTPQKMSRAIKGYYAALGQEQVPQVYEKVMDHENKLRTFGELIRERLDGIDGVGGIQTPELIQALSNGVTGVNGAINPDPNNLTNPRRVLRSSGFGRQIRNVADVIASNDLLDSRVVSMTYGGWDSHGSQRRIPDNFAADPNNPNQSLGIESGFRDIFGGQFGANPSDPDALHGGYSALMQSLSPSDRNNVMITIAGEFGRQIRDNGDRGTDHGSGNLMLVIGEQVAGGVYGTLFPDDEVAVYDDQDQSRPGIEPLTELDHIFSAVSDWMVPGSGDIVFPRTASGYSDPPIIEDDALFNGLFS